MAISLTKKSIQQLLDEAPTDEVFAFISKLVREDKKLAIQLLARFSDYLDETEEIKYDFLFYKPLLIYRTSKKPLGTIKQRKIGKIYRELWTQAGDAIVKKHFVKTAHILCNGLIYMRHIISGELRIETNFQQLYFDYHERMEYFISLKLPIELNDLIHETLTKELANENYSPPSNEMGVAYLLGRFYLNTHQLDVIYSQIKKLDRKNTQKDQKHKQQLLLTLTKNDMDPWRYRNKYDFGFSQLDFLFILEYLDKQGNYEQWNKLISRYYPKGTSKIIPKLRRHIEDRQAFISPKNSSNKTVTA